ncbi:uncharacterized protein ACJ7VT_014604 [Polymixia lowei]
MDKGNLTNLNSPCQEDTLIIHQALSHPHTTLLSPMVLLDVSPRLVEVTEAMAMDPDLVVGRVMGMGTGTGMDLSPGTGMGTGTAMDLSTGMDTDMDTDMGMGMGTGTGTGTGMGMGMGMGMGTDMDVDAVLQQFLQQQQ